MVSKAVASVDVWIAQAEEVLQEQRERSLSASSAKAWENVKHEPRVSLGSFELGIEDLLDRLCDGPGRWVLIAADAGTSNRFWQAMAFEDGSLVVEAANNSLHGGTEQSLPATEKLTELGWDVPDPPSRPNWRRVEATISPDIGAVANQAIRTLREVFEIKAVTSSCSPCWRCQSAGRRRPVNAWETLRPTSTQPRRDESSNRRRSNGPTTTEGSTWARRESGQHPRSKPGCPSAQTH